MSRRTILDHLRRHGTATNAELQDVACDHGGGIARTMAKLIAAGKARRADAARGRGHPATYALTENGR